MEPDHLLERKRRKMTGRETDWFAAGWMKESKTKGREGVRRCGEWSEKLVMKNREDQRVQKNHRWDWKGGVCVGVGLPIILSLCEVEFLVRACVCEQERTARERKRGGWRQTGIKSFAAMNVILIKPSRILRFSLWGENTKGAKEGKRRRDQRDREYKNEDGERWMDWWGGGWKTWTGLCHSHSCKNFLRENREECAVAKRARKVKVWNVWWKAEWEVKWKHRVRGREEEKKGVKKEGGWRKPWRNRRKAEWMDVDIPFSTAEMKEGKRGD